MTREEAVNYLKRSMAISEYDDSRYHNEVIEFTIKVLEQEPSVEDIHREREQAYMLGYEDASEKFRIEPCEDCISRAEEHGQLAEWLRELKQLREKTRWIPVSERLPEDSGEYLVSVIDEYNEDQRYYKAVEVAWFAHKKDYDIKESEWRELGMDETVIAWMPLPQSYSEVEE